MPDETLVRHCSPTLAGLKTGNLFNIAIVSREELRDDIRSLNRRLSGKGLRVLPVCCRNGRALIYIYRPDRLKRDLSRPEAAELLAERGYTGRSAEQLLVQLIIRLQNTAEFPHEIGLFLGYPPEDVRGFIENRADRCKCVGPWKVYGDETAARKTFCRFQKCTTVYCRQLASGKSIEQLAVAV